MVTFVSVTASSKAKPNFAYLKIATFSSSFLPVLPMKLQ